MTMLRRLHRALRPRREDREGGFVLVTVLGMATVMTLVLSATVAYGLQGSVDSARDKYTTEALNAAFAGVNDYIARMNLDTGYPYAPYATASICSKTGNNAFTQWVSIPGANPDSKFRYSIANCSTLTADGFVRLKASGIAGPTSGRDDPKVRTITATLKKARFLDYVYFTDKEDSDPSIAEYHIAAVDQPKCDVYNYGLISGVSTAKRPGASPGGGGSPACVNLSFQSSDTLDGDVHSNDAMSTNSATFGGTVTSACPAAVSTDPCYGKSPIKTLSGTPSYAYPPTAGISIGMPPSNTQIKLEADPATSVPLTGDVGYLCTGPTRIVFLSSGNLSITSPSSTAPNCPTGTNVAPPPNGRLYVQDIPAGTSTYTSAPCTVPYLTSPTASGNANTAGNKYPIVNDDSVNDCHSGEVWVEGAFKGNMTVAAQNNITITGDIKYVSGYGSTSTDMLGLVANNLIRYYQPMWCSPASKLQSDGSCSVALTKLCANPCIQNLEVDAAMLSVNHAIYLMHYADGDNKGTLKLRGSIAQHFRGAVISGSAGYSKDYAYDTRLRAGITPRGFLDPVTSAFKASEYEEAPVAYAGDTCWGGYYTATSAYPCIH